MYINEVAKATHLTKKAIEYYIEKGFIHPKIMSNGYRQFSIEDQKTLIEINLYRQCGLSIKEIKDILEDPCSLKDILLQRSIKINNDFKKHQLLQDYLENNDKEKLMMEIENISQQETIIEKLMTIFPGYFGRIIVLSFQPYFNIQIKTQEQQFAFDTIIQFLDNCPSFDIDDAFKKELDQMTCDISNQDIIQTLQSKEKNINNYKQFIESHKDTIENYLEYKETNEYKNSFLCKFQQLFKSFCQTTGYYDIFIPAMRKLNIEYDHYYLQLLEADDYLLQLYPHIQK